MSQKRSTSLRVSNNGQGGRLVRDIADSLGKLPPQANDLEESVLGSIMLYKKAIHDIADILHADDFYSEKHQTIYEACLELYKKSEPIDMVTVVSKLRSLGKLEIIGGAYYIAELTSKVSSAANIEYHARIIIEMAIKRDLIQIASEIHHSCYEDTSDAFEELEDAQSRLDSVGGKYLKGTFQSASEISKKVSEKITLRLGNHGVTGVETGLVLLDKVIGGWQDTDLIVIGARPGMGKTAFLLACAKWEAMNGIPTAIFSIEMSSEQLMIRAYSEIAQIENTRIFKNIINEDEHFKILEAGEKISATELYIDDSPALTIMEFRTKARRLVHEKKVKIIYVDYLQLMKGDSNSGTRDEEIGSISRGLKRTAKELNIPVVAMVQLSRAVETRGKEKRPMLSDLRESGNIEQDADIVAFLYRPIYYGITKDDQGHSTDNLLEVIISKHRNGGLETIPLKFIGKYTHVTNIEVPFEVGTLKDFTQTDKSDELPF